MWATGASVLYALYGSHRTGQTHGHRHTCARRWCMHVLTRHIPMRTYMFCVYCHDVPICVCVCVCVCVFACVPTCSAHVRCVISGQ